MGDRRETRKNGARSLRCRRRLHPEVTADIEEGEIGMIGVAHPRHVGETRHSFFLTADIAACSNIRVRAKIRLKSLVTRAVRVLGYDLVPRSAAPGLRSDFPEPDFTERDIRDYERVKPFTLTSSERVLALTQAIRHVVRSGLEGAIVECGVWVGR
jgi:hypothetical protein